MHKNTRNLSFVHWRLLRLIVSSEAEAACYTTAITSAVNPLWRRRSTTPLPPPLCSAAIRRRHYHPLLHYGYFCQFLSKKTKDCALVHERELLVF